MELSENAEEVLETLWMKIKEGRSPGVHHSRIGLDSRNRLIRELLEKDLIRKSNGEISFTRRGLIEAENVIRRLRLAERLLTDVLNVKENLEETACRFEHLLHRGIDENVCTLLGHPRFCPHGSPIPSGKCCKINLQRMERIISPLSMLEPGQKGSVAYISSEDSQKLQKLVSMGILPGRPIKLDQKFPAYVFQIDHTQIAVDDEIAREIYIRVENR